MEEQAHGHPHFEIVVDHHPHNWHDQFISGLELKNLAGVDPNTYSVYMKVTGPDDPEIANDQKVDLRDPHHRHFFTGKKHTTEG